MKKLLIFIFIILLYACSHSVYIDQIDVWVVKVSPVDRSIASGSAALSTYDEYIAYTNNVVNTNQLTPFTPSYFDNYSLIIIFFTIPHDHSLIPYEVDYIILKNKKVNVILSYPEFNSLEPVNQVMTPVGVYIRIEHYEITDVTFQLFYT